MTEFFAQTVSSSCGNTDKGPLTTALRELETAEVALRQVGGAWILGEDATDEIRALRDNHLQHLRKSVATANNNFIIHLSQFRFNETPEDSDLQAEPTHCSIPPELLKNLKARAAEKEKDRRQILKELNKDKSRFKPYTKAAAPALPAAPTPPLGPPQPSAATGLSPHYIPPPGQAFPLQLQSPVTLDPSPLSLPPMQAAALHPQQPQLDPGFSAFNHSIYGGSGGQRFYPYHHPQQFPPQPAPQQPAHAPIYQQGQPLTQPFYPSQPQFGLSPAAATIQMRKAKTRCVRCGAMGHWRDDGVCKPEDISAKQLQDRYTSAMKQMPPNQAEIASIMQEFQLLQQSYPTVVPLRNPPQYQLALPQPSGN